MSLPVFIPITSTLSLPLVSDSVSSVYRLLRAIWTEQYLLLPKVEFSQLSLRALVKPVPVQPNGTLHKRVMDSARNLGWDHTTYEDEVPSCWWDTETVHIFLYVDQGCVMRAAENLHEKLWGQSLDDKLTVLYGDEQEVWTYLSTEQLDSLQLGQLGYCEDALLFREEYSVAVESFDLENAGGCHQVVVTGQPGNGKSCFLFYLLLQLLSKGMSVALERSHRFFLFSDNGVTMHALDEKFDHVFPKITWALSDLDGNIREPCPAFLDAYQQDRAWIIQTTSPLESVWNLPGLFIMKSFSACEITALGKIIGLDVSNLQRIYEEWGPSTRTCLQLSRTPITEMLHEDNVIIAAAEFVRLAPTGNITTVSDVLFSMEPNGLTKELRQESIRYIATDRIKNIILYAAADAEARDRLSFYLTISKEPGFRNFAGTMFKDLALSWFYGNCYIPCVAAQLECTPSLQIPYCGENNTVFFASKKALRKDLRMKSLPLLLFPTSPEFTTIDAVVLTEESIITIQVAISDSHPVNRGDFAIIEDYLPNATRRSKRWCHVFITDDENSATSLRSQTFKGLPSEVQIYSTVFDVGTPGIDRELVKDFNNKKNKQLKTMTQA